MVVLNKIYTRTGDDGTTGLVNGERRPKFDIRISAVGAVDEANAQIGAARVETAKRHSEVDDALARVQNDLFDLGADLATPQNGGTEPDGNLRISVSQIDRLEKAIDALNGALEPLRSFVLPGGSEAAARLHLARTAVRRAERAVAELAEREPVNVNCGKYLNRLSDLLFVAARTANMGETGDVLWVPGRDR